ncbi:ABC transporter ATP-binding protein [Granulicella aggregans]|jgi:NitT/TauT family transport system ATP-binding protein|uniref:ABC transporter ATP-binding protein n=1 Tax=Granulicella aggregans TaxID=474949 RepID=UPI0021E04B09|nr:ABC transporter ATP-binding protein [Granulicella aggregans]
MTNETITVPAIAIDRATKSYGTGTTILKDISLNVARKEFVSIIGPSGCGKSTLLKLVAGLSPITSGTIAVDGMTPTNAREIVSFIFQEATLLPWRTVRQNIVLGLELEGMARERRTEKVNEVLQLVGLAHVADSYPRQLSGGMKMRVSIARALATRPQVLLLDEPFAALDEMTRDRINEDLLRLRAEQGWTSLFVTHSVAEAVFLSTRILVLAPHPGRVAHDIAIDLPFPRNEETRSTPAYEQAVVEVSRALRSVSVGGNTNL